MNATDTEKRIIEALRCCRYLPGLFDKKFCTIDGNNISPLQRWYIYFQGHKYRKQIGNDILTLICKNFIDCNPKPLSRREAQQILKQAIRHETRNRVP